jgi:hypothetical protein
MGLSIADITALPEEPARPGERAEFFGAVAAARSAITGPGSW